MQIVNVDLNFLVGVNNAKFMWPKFQNIRFE